VVYPLAAETIVPLPTCAVKSHKIDDILGGNYVWQCVRGDYGGLKT